MQIAFRAALLAAGLAACTVPALADAPFNFDTAPGRLPKNVRPIAYRIHVTPDAKALKIAGTESILLLVRSSTATIQFNSLNDVLSGVRFDGAPVAKTVTSDAQQLTTVTLAHPAAVGRHTLTFAYTGKIETGPQGLFFQPYVTPEGKHDAMLSTQLEATDARRMFPCWDEPAFRATFQLTATVPADLTNISNMPVVKRTVRGNLATTVFAPTPSMASYLLEYTVGHIAHIQATHGGTLFRVWAVKGQENNGAIALANAQQILADYNAYFGVNFPLPKLDSIAVPGGFEGAMENWGAITYNDHVLLVTPASTIGDRQQIYSIQAHEMAHQWNGDLVTMGWWDDLWLNESFASWRSAKETDLRNPSWNWWENQDGDKESAMNADARRTSHPIHVAINNELEAETSADSEITYSKGQAFLRMLEAYLTPDVFRDGIRRYMQARKFNSATSADLWAALSAASHRDVGALSSNWINKPGFPLVSATATCTNGHRTISLAQQRFLLAGTDTAHTQWMIPLAIRSGVSGPSTRVLFATPGQTVAAGACSDPLTLNAGLVGFYRVAYDDATLKTNIAAFGTLPNADRIALLDDQWALAQAGKAPLATYLTIAGSMGSDIDAAAWSRIAASLDTLEQDERGTPGHAAFLTYARSILKPVAVALGWDPKPNDTPDIGDLRRTAIGYLGFWGDPDVIAEARKRFAAYRADHTAIPVDYQSTVFNIVAHGADATTFDQLHALAKAATDSTEIGRIQNAMMLVSDDDLAKRAAEIALSDEVPPQDAANRVQFIFELADFHPAMAWALFKAHADEILKPFGPLEGPVALAQYTPDGFWNAAPLDEIEAWIKSKIQPPYYPLLQRGMERARFHVAQQKLLDTAADAYVAQH